MLVKVFVLWLWDGCRLDLWVAGRVSEWTHLHAPLSPTMLTDIKEMSWKCGAHKPHRVSCQSLNTILDKLCVGCRKLRIWFHFPKILCQPLFLNYAKHICRVLSPTGLIFVCTVIMTVPFISTYFFLRFGWTSTKSIIMTGTYLLFQSDVSLYGAFFDGFGQQ